MDVLSVKFAWKAPLTCRLRRIVYVSVRFEFLSRVNIEQLSIAHAGVVLKRLNRSSSNERCMAAEAEGCITMSD